MNSSKPDPKKVAIGCGLFIVAALLVGGAILTFAEGPEIPAEITTPAPPSQSEAGTIPADPQDVARLEGLRSAVADGRLWRGLPEAPLGMCEYQDDQRMCVADQIRFIEADWPKAWAGDYSAQRNVAYCYKTGCDGSLMPNPIQACAWRLVIARTGGSDLTPGDSANYELDCRLPAASAATADSAAAEILSRIQ